MQMASFSNLLKLATAVLQISFCMQAAQAAQAANADSDLYGEARPVIIRGCAGEVMEPCVSLDGHFSFKPPPLASRAKDTKRRRIAMQKCLVADRPDFTVAKETTDGNWPQIFAEDFDVMIGAAIKMLTAAKAGK
jgi:hypothetical protein